MRPNIEADSLNSAQPLIDADGAQAVHDREVFGPVATLLPYRDLAHAQALAERGQESLVASLYGDDAPTLAASARRCKPAPQCSRPWACEARHSDRKHP